MQRVTNCILKRGNDVLTLQKPSRGWWVAPGGKMEQGESVRDSVVREFREETGLQLKDPSLRGVFTILIEQDGSIINEWMLFTFCAESFAGEMLTQSPEGILSWTKTSDIQGLPMAEGDYQIFEHVLNHDKTVYGTFKYTENFKLLFYRIEAEGEAPEEFHAGS
ncbi:8-oxo-dGTP diphosphatase [Evansella sp. LMS18]|uniref:NUDIX hydrolase n=1 Tax=Evansella sp. LMS18 TaxID=2924033 RepID=UPI0020D028D8|nr:8-oxo-dGTP diphosphatase [Evansella sp. LMS18]UTR11713.1 8-oxo-dGTP diphosphatase [Evansella sp. LMS18]